MNKDKKNTSKLFYWNLTYKEKFQRTLIVLPFLIMAIISILYKNKAMSSSRRRMTLMK